MAMDAHVHVNVGARVHVLVDAVVHVSAHVDAHASMEGSSKDQHGCMDNQ